MPSQKLLTMLTPSYCASVQEWFSSVPQTNTQEHLGSYLPMEFYLASLSYDEIKLVCLRMTMVGCKCPQSRFMPGHPLHSVRAVCVLSMGHWTCLETCSSANTLFKKAKEQEIASIQPSCKPGSAENCHFFGSKEGILKPMRKCNGLIYLDGSVFL